MKSVLCFGDSNTYGYDVVLDRRFPRAERWCGVLERELGPDYEVIEEGQGSRTTIWEDPMFPYKKGKDYLIPCLESHAPLDVVVLLLGTNDLKAHLRRTAYQAAQGVSVLVHIILNSGAGPDGGAPKVVLLSPPLVGTLSTYREIYHGAPEKSRQLGKHFKAVAETYKCAFLDTAPLIVPSIHDGVHFEQPDHEKLGQAVAGIIRDLFPTS